VYEIELSTELGKKHEAPDLVYGLRKVGSIERYLSTKDARPNAGGNILGSTIRSSPFKDDTQTLFPFLVNESKSEKAGMSQSAVEC
jgi:hypothetical protein